MLTILDTKQHAETIARVMISDIDMAEMSHTINSECLLSTTFEDIQILVRLLMTNNSFESAFIKWSK